MRLQILAGAAALALVSNAALAQQANPRTADSTPAAAAERALADGTTAAPDSTAVGAHTNASDASGTLAEAVKRTKDAAAGKPQAEAASEKPTKKK